MGDGLAVTPAVGLTWSDVSLSFTEPPGMDDGLRWGPGVDRGRAEPRRPRRLACGSRRGRTDGPRLFGSVEATHEFSDDRTAKFSMARR